MAAGVALLVLDAQNDIMGFQDQESLPGMIATTARLAGWARASGIPVIYSRVAFRSSYIDVLPQLPSVKDYRILNEVERGSAVIDDLAPQVSDIVVVKRRVCAFHGTDLDLVLRALGVGVILYAGVSTDRVVESTVRDASDRGYRNIVISDACASSTPQRHRASLESIADFFGEVMTADQAIQALS